MDTSTFTFTLTNCVFACTSQIAFPISTLRRSWWSTAMQTKQSRHVTTRRRGLCAKTSGAGLRQASHQDLRAERRAPSGLRRPWRSTAHNNEKQADAHGITSANNRSTMLQAEGRHCTTRPTSTSGADNNMKQLHRPPMTKRST